MRGNLDFTGGRFENLHLDRAGLNGLGKFDKVTATARLLRECLFGFDPNPLIIIPDDGVDHVGPM